MKRKNKLEEKLEFEQILQYIKTYCLSLSAEKLVDKINEGELPKTKKEFMSQAELYHTLMDLEEFLMYKKRFIQEIDDIQFQIYWKKEVEGK